MGLSHPHVPGGHHGVPGEPNLPVGAELIFKTWCCVAEEAEAVACLLEALGECENRFIEWLVGDVAPPLGE